MYHVHDAGVGEVIDDNNTNTKMLPMVLLQFPSNKSLCLLRIHALLMSCNFHQHWQAKHRIQLPTSARGCPPSFHIQLTLLAITISNNISISNLQVDNYETLNDISVRKQNQWQHASHKTTHVQIFLLSLSTPCQYSTFRSSKSAGKDSNVKSATRTHCTVMMSTLSAYSIQEI